MVPARTSISRRRFLAAAGVSALGASAGCTSLGDAVGSLRGHVHNSDADISGDTGPWPTQGANAQRTGQVDRTAPDVDANVLEVATVGRYAESQPAVVDERVYVGVDRRETQTSEAPFSGVVALKAGDEDRGASTAWRASEGGGTVSFTPSVAGSTVFAPVGEGVKALDARDGSVHWRTAAGGGTPTVVGETCFSFHAGAGVVALDAVTGATHWTSGDLEAAPSGFAAVEDAVALASGGGGEGGLYCYERIDGDQRWRYPLGESYAAPVTDGERVYAVGTDGYLDAVTLSGGERAWRHPFEGESYQRVTVADGTVYAAGTNDETLVALDAATGDHRWRRSLGVGGPSPAAVTAESLVLVAVTKEGRQLFVLDRADGSTRARFDLPDGLFEEIQPVVGDGVAYTVAEPATEPQAFLYAVR